MKLYKGKEPARPCRLSPSPTSQDIAYPGSIPKDRFERQLVNGLVYGARGCRVLDKAGDPWFPRRKYKGFAGFPLALE